MKPCCIPSSQECINLTPAQEGQCDGWGGTLGPEGACCYSQPNDESCPELDRCWKCDWDATEPLTPTNCCYTEYGFEYVAGTTRNQCSSCAGLEVDGPGDCRPVGGPVRACCGSGGNHCVNMQSEFWRCEAGGGTLGPLGLCCANPTGPPLICPVAGVNPCWLCDYEVNTLQDYRTTCCFPELSYQWFPYAPPGELGLYTTQCRSCGGVSGETEDDCQAEPREQECIVAGDDRLPPYENVHRWTLDTMGTVVFGLTDVTEDYPLDWPRGYNYGLSTHLTRPREPDTPVNACGHAVGRLTMLDDGYVYMETCSLPDVNNLDSHRRSYGVLWTAPETDLRIGVEAGYQYWVTCIRLPAWTEALYRSHQRLCTSEPV